MSIKISQLNTDLPLIDVPIKFDDEGKPEAGFLVCGSNSEEYRKAVENATAKTIQRSATRGRQVQLASDEGARMAAASQTLERLEVAVACTKKSYGFVDDDGTDHQFTTEEKRALFTEWVEWRDLVWASVKREANFTKS